MSLAKKKKKPHTRTEGFCPSFSRQTTYIIPLGRGDSMLCPLFHFFLTLYWQGAKFQTVKLLKSGHCIKMLIRHLPGLVIAVTLH